MTNTFLGCRSMSTIRIAAFTAVILAGNGLAHAEVVNVDVRARRPFSAGEAFGATGPYEQITGIVRFAVDPQHPRNRAIVDLSRAPRSVDGKVEFESDLC